jgi:hypothetical protein
MNKSPFTCMNEIGAHLDNKLLNGLGTTHHDNNVMIKGWLNEELISTRIKER